MLLANFSSINTINYVKKVLYGCSFRILARLSQNFLSCNVQGFFTPENLNTIAFSIALPAELSRVGRMRNRLYRRVILLLGLTNN